MFPFIFPKFQLQVVSGVSSKRLIENVISNIRVLNVTV